MNSLNPTTRQNIICLIQELVWSYNRKIYFCRTKYSILTQVTPDLSYHLFFTNQAASALNESQELIKILNSLQAKEKFKLHEEENLGEFQSIKDILNHAIKQEHHIAKTCDLLLSILDENNLKAVQSIVFMKLKCYQNIAKLHNFTLYSSSNSPLPTACIV